MRVQPPLQKSDFVEKNGRLTPQALQFLSNLINNVQGEDEASGVIQLGPINIRYGSGSPLGAVTGSPPDLYIRLDGGAGTCLYVKESGTDTTAGWVAK